MLINKETKATPYPPLLWDEIKSIFNVTSIAQKTNIVSKIGYVVENGFLEYEEYFLKDCLKFLTSDFDEATRALLSTKLQYSPNLPHDIAIQLCYDIADIAIPIITNSPKLNDDDLMEMLDNFKEQNKLYAISKRNYLSEITTAKLIATQNIPLLINLLNNPTSKISLESYTYLFITFHNDHNCMSALLNRNELDNKQLQRIFLDLDSEVKEIIEKFIKTQYEDKSSFCRIEIVSQPQPSVKEDIAQKREIDLLFTKNQLNSAIVLYYLCNCDLLSFLYCLSKLTDTTFNQIKHIALTSLDSNQFDKLYKEANLPFHLLLAVKALIKVIISEQEKRELDLSSEHFLNRVLYNIKQSNLEHKIPEMEYLLKLIRS